MLEGFSGVLYLTDGELLCQAGVLNLPKQKSCHFETLQLIYCLHLASFTTPALLSGLLDFAGPSVLLCTPPLLTEAEWI